MNETRPQRERLARAYMRLARESHAAAVAKEKQQDRLELELAEIMRRRDACLAWDDQADADGLLLEGHRIELEAEKIERKAKRLQGEAERYHKSADELLRCGSGVFELAAPDCPTCAETGRKRHVVSGCNRVGCPNDSPGRARETVARWTPKLHDLMGVRVLMLSAKNVPFGKLGLGLKQLQDAIRRFREHPYVKARWDAGVYAIEVTVGRAPRELWATAKAPPKGKFWHPHLHVIVGRVNEPKSGEPDFDRYVRVWDVPTAEHPIDYAKEKAELQAVWRSCLRPIPELDGEMETQTLGARRRRPRASIDYEPIVWIDRPYVKRGKDKIYGLDDEQLAHAATEAFKYITKGIDEIPSNALPELIREKETRRWLQGWGQLHENGRGLRGCRACRKECPNAHDLETLSEAELSPLLAADLVDDGEHRGRSRDSRCGDGAGAWMERATDLARGLDARGDLAPGVSARVEAAGLHPEMSGVRVLDAAEGALSPVRAGPPGVGGPPPRARCAGAGLWKLKEHGENCPCCGAKGETPRQLEEPEPAKCEHGFPLRFVGFAAPRAENDGGVLTLDRDAWRELKPIGLLRPRSGWVKKRVAGEFFQGSPTSEASFSTRNP